MEVVNLKPNEKIIEAYGLKPNLFFDIEGTLLQKEGKDIKIEKTVANKNINYSLRIIDEIDGQVGDKVTISKDNILSIELDTKEETKESNINVKEAIKKLGVNDTEEARESIEYLIENGIPITKDNLESFLSSKRYLKEIVENLDFDSCTQLLNGDIDINEGSLQKVAEALSEIKDNKHISIKEILKLTRKLSYKEAETISKDIYGRKMGKDVYDTIIALHKERIPVNKENIEKVLEVIDKLYDLKDYDDQIFVKVLKDNVTANIETLHKLKYSYKNGELNQNITSSLYEQFTIEKDISIEDILKILKELNIEQNQTNIQLIREFLLNEVELTKSNIEKIMNMKSDLGELINLSNQQNVTKLIEDGVDPLNEDISTLVHRIKYQSDKNMEMDLTKVDNILNELESLNTITDKELLLLIKNEEDFKVENLKRIIETDKNLYDGINGRTAEKVISISNIFNTLGNLDSGTISLATKRYNHLTLNNLYNSHIELVKGEIKVNPISESQESLIRQEYLNIRQNTTISLIKESIKDEVAMEQMALEELNEYIDKKVGKYRETQRILNDIRHIKGKEESIIPIVMKNNLNMSLRQISNINSVLNRSQGIGSVFEQLVKAKNSYDKDTIKGIELLENRIKEFTNSLKEGKDSIKEDYKEVLNGFTDLSNSSGSGKENEDEHRDRIKKYLDLQNNMKDIVLQLPVSLGENYNNINLIIPNMKKGIDGNNMVFYISLNTEKLGQTKFKLQVKGKDISIDFETENNKKVLNYKHILESRLNKLGYRLEIIQPSKLS